MDVRIEFGASYGGNPVDERLEFWIHHNVYNFFPSHYFFVNDFGWPTPSSRKKKKLFKRNKWIVQCQIEYFNVYPGWSNDGFATSQVFKLNLVIYSLHLNLTQVTTTTTATMIIITVLAKFVGGSWHGRSGARRRRQWLMNSRFHCRLQWSSPSPSPWWSWSRCTIQYTRIRVVQFSLQNS